LKRNLLGIHLSETETLHYFAVDMFFVEVIFLFYT
jgi:hypothetical protein